MFAEWGAADGFAVVELHGGPGSRFARYFDERVYVEVGARVITYDRPGYGGSDRHRGRRVADCVADVAAIADQLEIERFAVTGGSAGGPHCLAVAAALPERVTRASCVVGLAPFDAPDVEWFAGMDPLNVREIEWALEGEEVLARELEREAAEMLEQVARDPSTFLSDWQLSQSDRDKLAEREGYEVLRQTIEEAFRPGIWGYVDDTLCLIRPWGFSVSEIRIPTRIVYGLTDVLVPRQHGEWLARNVPGSEAVVRDLGGHMSDRDQVIDDYRWLVERK
jgi:pimeloyl-ACP methyl ester carboxylesterase